MKRLALKTTSGCLLILAGAVASCRLTGVNEAARRVELIAQLDRLVVVVLAEGRGISGGSVDAELIQTDAAINAGNSGGPMFNSRGEVIAIAQSILMEGGGSEGLGFGLAINAVKRLVGLDRCLWMGFSAVLVNETWAAILNVPEPAALLVERVTPGGPADQAGIHGGEIPVQVGRDHLLLGGDVILRAEGVPILDWIRERRPPPSRPGEIHEIRLTLLRAGVTREVTVRVTHRNANWE